MAWGFRALSKAEQVAVATHVKREYDRMVFQQPNSYLSKNAQSDPEARQIRLRELIAGDENRVAAIAKAYLGTAGGVQSGFTLIELSIVLVIIGLIVGGVLTGRDLIKAAEVRATITQVEKFNQAVNTFYGKYGALPGDLNQQVATTFGFTQRGLYPGQGDGNGILQGVSADYASGVNWGFVDGAGETVMFWVDLTSANGLKVNLIEGSFSSASPNTPPASITGSAIPNYFPQAKLGGGNYFYVYSVTNDLGQGNPVNYFGVSAISGVLPAGCNYCIYSTPGVTVKQAYDIDKKIDDGLPTTGNVIAQYVDGNSFGGGAVGYAPNAATDSASTCYNSSTNNFSVTVSNGSNVNCALSFKMQGGD